MGHYGSSPQQPPAANQLLCHSDPILSLSIYVRIRQNLGYSACYFKLFHTTLYDIVMLHLIMMSHMNTHDIPYDVIITSLAQPIKVPHSAYQGSFWFLSPWVRYSCMQGLTH